VATVGNAGQEMLAELWSVRPRHGKIVAHDGSHDTALGAVGSWPRGS
jgi:hypothetical protein